MEKLNRYIYFLKQGIVGLWKNRLFTVASIATISASLFLIGSFRMVSMNLQHMLKEAETNVGITTFFVDGTTEEEILLIKEEIEKRPEVDSVNYVSGEEAWARYKEVVLSSELAESFGDDNPLKDSSSLEIYMKDVGVQAELVSYLYTKSIVRQVNSSETTASNITQMIEVITWVCALLIAVLVAISVILIGITVTMGINIRRDEIYIMNVIGAADVYIKAPFVIEGIFIGSVGAILPIFFIKTFYGIVVNHLNNEFGMIFESLTFVSEDVLMNTMIPMVLLIGLGIGVAGSYLATELQIRRIEISQ